MVSDGGLGGRRGERVLGSSCVALAGIITHKINGAKGRGS